MKTNDSKMLKTKLNTILILFNKRIKYINHPIWKDYIKVRNKRHYRKIQQMYRTKYIKTNDCKILKIKLNTILILFNERIKYVNHPISKHS